MSITSVANDLVTSVSVINAQKPLPPTISGYSVGGVDDTALDPAGGQTVLINGTGFLAGATITFDGSAVAVVTYVNPNQLTFTSPAKSAGTYTIYVVNADGGTAIYIPGIIYSVLPTWTTSAGTLGSYYETTSISNTVIASGDAPITYALYSGSLPTGSTLYANGVITGTAPVDSSSTTYSFTIQATDAQLQDSTRSFSLTINVDAVTWVTPANATTYTTAVDSVIANVALSATDAAGYSVSYSANALPTGLTLTGSNISGTPTVIADSSTLLTATAATTTRSAVRTINWSITVANDPYFEYNTLLIPGASTTFVDDASTNNFAVTIAGDTKPNNFNPYSPGYYSNYFDGTGDYLTVPDNTVFSFGTGDFTVEAWICPTSLSPSYQAVVAKRSGDTSATVGWGIYITSVGSNAALFNFSDGTTSYALQHQTTLVAGTWYHLAMVRSGNTINGYVNGVGLTSPQTVSSGYTINGSGPTVYVGYASSGSAIVAFNGYISNTRILKGTAVYTSAFTPSTTPLTAIANTSLLTCQSNRFIDNSTNTFPLTVSGNTSIRSFIPFTPNSNYRLYGSGYFDGTGDSIYSSVSAAGAGSFTYEAWVYPVAFASNKTIFRTDNGGSLDISLLCNSTGQLLSYDNSGTLLASTTTTLQLNTWAYVALVRNGTAMQIYINGVESRTGGSGTFSNNITYTQLDIGGRSTNGDESWNGYITDARYTKSAVYTSAFTPPSAPLTAIANTSLLTLQNNQSVNNNVFLDNSTNNFLVTRAGNTTQGTFSPYGGNWSNYFSGSSYLTTPSSAAFNFAGVDWTIETWIYPTSAIAADYTNILQSLTGTNNWIPYLSIGLMVDRRISVSLNAVFYITTQTISLNNWNHLALVRSGGIVKLYINGIASSVSITVDIINSNLSFWIGKIDNSPGGGSYIYYFPGYISNLRIVKGTAVYTGTFTPPTAPLTATQSAGTNIAAITNGATSLLTCQSNRFIDTSINAYAVTVTGSTIQRFSPFNPLLVTPTSYSGYFDGTGDYLTVPDNTALQFSTGAFTMELWFYPTVTISSQILLAKGIGGDGFEFRSRSSGGGNYFSFWAANGSTAIVESNVTFTLNTWQHLAVVRSSGTMTLYKNGVNVGSASDSTSFVASGSALRVAVDVTAGNLYSTGYISNVRIVKGVAVYTGAFTVPTSPLAATQSSGTNIAAITGTSTSLLTLQSPTFIDNSTNNFTISAFGNSQPTQQNPFGYTSATTQGYTASTIGGSGYFDGSGDYLQPSATANTAMMAIANSLITIEFWVYTTTIQAVTAYVTSIFGQYLGVAINGRYMITLAGSGTISSQQVRFAWTTSPSTDTSVTSSTYLNQNSWNHVAITIDSTTPSSSTITIYSNGVGQIFTGNNLSSQTVDNGSPFYIGAEYGGNYQGLSGYLSDFRFLRGQLVYKSNFVPPSAPLTAVQNTTLLTNMTSAGVYDAAMMNNMETVGDAKLSTAISKFGGSSMAFDGTGDYVLSSTSANLYAFGAGDFTIELWVYTNSVAATDQALVDFRTANGYYPYLYLFNGRVGYWLNSVDVITGSPGSITAGSWYHIALTRSGSSTKLFVNGTQSGSTYTSATALLCGVNRPAIGSSGTSLGAYPLNGYVDDLRVTKGYARYTANFTPPTSAFPIY